MPPLDRRALLKLIAGGAAATMAGCSRPDDLIYPLANQPEGTHPGVVRRYATAVPLAGYWRGVTGLVVDERPIKLEGLASHPASLGATDLFAETAILDLYDPQRLRAVGGPEGAGSWDEAARALWPRIASAKGERVALLTGRITSPTLLARIAAWQARLPGLRHVRWEPFGDDAVLAGTQAAFGRRLMPRPRLADADVILCLGADPLGPGPEQVALARAWSERRRRGTMPRLYVLEPSPTATGVMADLRVAASPRELALACRSLATTLGGGGEFSPAPSHPHPSHSPVASGPLPSPTGRGRGASAPMGEDDASGLARIWRDLAGAKGRALVLAGERQPPEVHAFAAWANAQLQAPVDYIAPVDPDPAPHREGLAALQRDMAAGRIDALIVLDANPAYAAPGFAQAMAKVPLTVSATIFPDETSALTQWRLPIAHPLERWNDGRAPDGTATLAQPLIRPLHDTRSPVGLIDWLMDPGSTDTDLLRHRRQWAALDDHAWQQALTTGIVPGTAAKPEPVGAARLTLPPVPADGPKLELRPSPTLYDGRHSTNAWAQECPDPLTKEVWGASVRLHPADMAALGVAEGDLVRLEQGGAIALPARSTAGQARGVATVLAGYGRRHSGAVADGIGANGFALTGQGALKLAKGDGRRQVPTTQHQFALPGELAKLFPVVSPGHPLPRQPDRLPTLLPNPPTKSAPPQWAMAIDTDVCIGCNACVVACQAENNVPVVGPDEIEAGRTMHWLRVDRYDHQAGGGFQPVPCMQCETAPCEPVCPVEASIHDEQGLNLQVYNRCVGTRTCEANCPYRVRRFNFRDYANRSVWGDAEDVSVTAQRNPDVTVRARGVMEKCTYCVQRIEAATREGDAGGTPGPVVTACQAACPTRAISFGPLDGADIKTARADPRHYALLGELGTKPRTTYLARRRAVDEG